MPKYEYACVTCKRHTEVNRSFNDEEVVPNCAYCGSITSRYYGSVGVQFKGSGFYKTDNK